MTNRSYVKFSVQLFAFIFCFYVASAENKFWVKKNDPRYITHKEGDNYCLKDSLPDGHYCVYDPSYQQMFPIQEVSYRNRKKDGVENWFSAYGHELTASITWQNGQKNGPATLWISDMQDSLNFRNNELNGKYRWYENKTMRGEGYFTNGFRDSVWSYYEKRHDALDGVDYGLRYQVKYVKGEEILITAWDRRGRQIVSNGGPISNGSTAINCTDLPINLRNGSCVIKDDNVIKSVRTYKEGIMTKEVNYFNHGKIASVSQFISNGPGKPDTTRRDFGMFYGIWVNDISFKNEPIRDGEWSSYFVNGRQNYKGAYNSGQRIGKWKWYYPNGAKRIIADFPQNKWLHFDVSGKISSTYQGEFLTILTSKEWFPLTPLGDDSFVLVRNYWYDNENIEPDDSGVVDLVFKYNGGITAKMHHDCDGWYDSHLYRYSLLGNILNIDILKGKKKTYKYLISQEGDKKLTMTAVK